MLAVALQEVPERPGRAPREPDDPETGRNMYQGVARLEVTVYAAGVEESKYQYSHECKMPDQPAYTSDVSAYRAKFLDQIVLELAARHTEHLSDPRVPPLRP